MELSQDVFEISHNTKIRLDTKKFIIETWKNENRERLREIPYDKIHTIILTKDHSALFFNVGYILLFIGIAFIIGTTFIFHGFFFLIASIAMFYAGKDKEKRFIILIRGEKYVELPFSASNIITLIEDRVRTVRKISPEHNIFKVSI